MGGEIDVISTEGQGTSFYFTASFKLQDEQEFTEEIDLLNTAKNIKPTVKKKILLAEDDEVSRKMVTKILNRRDFDVLAVDDGMKAVEACNKEKFDLILMDVYMPILDGYKTTNVIRNESTLNKSTPIIAMTAYALSGDKEKCLEAGMYDYISKPIDIQSFYNLIEKWLSK
jgi:CheY-like chemotaxis protein